VRTWLAIALPLTLLLACGRKPGDRCTARATPFCRDRATAAACVDDRWQDVPCRGPGGCVPSIHESLRPECDRSVALVGDPCPASLASLESSHACSLDRTEVLACDGARYEPLAACDGPGGCAESTTGTPDASWRMLSCDALTGVSGKVCAGTIAACTADRRALLQCLPVVGSWSTYGPPIPCRGPAGCHGVECDQSIARAGEPCWVGARDACSEDRQQLLRCDGDGKRSLVYACKGPKACEPTGTFDGKGTLDKAFCDQSVGDVGEACAAEGFGTCSTDRRALLTCKAGKLEQVSVCVGEPCRAEGLTLKCGKG
jgi:hypothetical protein